MKSWIVWPTWLAAPTTVILGQVQMADGSVNWAQGGVIGLMLGAFLAAGKFILDRVFTQNQETINTITASNEKVNKDLAEKMEAGFNRVAEVMERRDQQQQGLFDKHLDVTIKVTESLGSLGRSVADNTREIGDLKSEVRDLKRPGSV